MSTELGDITRRRFVKTVGATAAAGFGAGIAMPAIGQGMTRIKMTLPWLAQGSHLFAFVARNKGYWRGRGLDVEIARGFGSGAAIQALSQGQFDVAIIAGPAVLLSNARGLDTIAMGVAGYDIGMGLMSLEDGPVKSVKDLEGRRLGSTPTSVEVPYIAPFLERSGTDLAKISRVQLAANVIETSLINKQVDAISAVATSNMPNLIAQGIRFRFFPFSAQGVRLYTNAFLTTPQFFSANRTVCRAWVEGLVDSLKFCMTNFDEAVEIFLKEVPEVRMSSTGKEFTKVGAGLFLATEISPEVTSGGLGWIDMTSVENQADLVMQFVAMDGKKPDVAQTWTNEFVGKVKLSEAEIATAKKATADYAKMLNFI